METQINIDLSAPYTLFTEVNKGKDQDYALERFTMGFETLDDLRLVAVGWRERQDCTYLEIFQGTDSIWYEIKLRGISSNG